MADFDIAIIGGGINGTAIARDAAGRGQRVLLVEQDDLASGTSSASSKLIHGGLRYLEHGAFRLVREALHEREVLLRMAPHIIRPMRFVLPPLKGRRSPLLLRLALFIYDRLGGREILPGTKTVDLTHHSFGVPLQRMFRYGFEYSDCAVDDARLVILNARDAADRGADIRTRTKCVRVERGYDWELVLNNRGRRETATARVLVNAAGAWIGQVAETVLRIPLKDSVRLVKGSHIVVKRYFDHDGGYTFQAADGRVVFAVPLGDAHILIGTTDEPFVGDVAAPGPTEKEINYLAATVNDYFRERVTPTDVVWAYAGVRSLHDDGSKKPEDVTRDYTLTLDEKYGEGALLTVYGGKITTSRRLAEAALAKVRHFVELSTPWTADSTLPGGGFAPDEFEQQVTRARNRWPFLTDEHARRLVAAYGTLIDDVLGDAGAMSDLGPCFAGDLTGAEIEYLMVREWAQTAEDVLWRRTKRGLDATPADVAAIGQFMAEAAARRGKRG